MGMGLPGNWVCFTWLGSGVVGGTWWEEFTGEEIAMMPGLSLLPTGSQNTLGASTKEGCVYRLKDKDMICCKQVSWKPGHWEHSEDGIWRRACDRCQLGAFFQASSSGLKFSSAGDVYFLHCFSVE